MPKIMAKAEAESSAMKDEFVASEHLSWRSSRWSPASRR